MQFAFIAIALIVIMAAILASVLLRHRSVASTTCPHCERNIHSSSLTVYGICPECGTDFRDSGAVTAPGNMVSRCHRCQMDADTFKLWDNECYCRKCIDQHSPRLMIEAQSPALVEEMPSYIVTILLRASVLFLSAPVAIASIAGVILASQGKWNLILPIYGVFLLISSPILLLLITSVVMGILLLRPKIMVMSGKVIVRTGATIIAAPLKECSWGYGKLSKTTVSTMAFLLPGNTLIIELSDRYTHRRHRIGVGFTSETADLWKAFLTLADVSRA